MKKCTKCGMSKPVSEFNVRRASKNGLHYRCKSCCNELNRVWYGSNKSRVIRKKADQKLRNKLYILDYLQKHPCVDCGEDDPIVLEFDHVRDKFVEVSMAWQHGWSLERIQSEIDKCEVRCANCHKRKTYKGTYKDIAPVAER